MKGNASPDEQQQGEGDDQEPVIERKIDCGAEHYTSV
jgi:hypothetical protein